MASRPSPRSETGASPRPVPLSVLIVDDIPDIRVGYRMLLEADGCQVLEAGDVPTAMAALARTKVDVVLTDIYLPGKLDGMDLVEYVLHQPAPRPAVIAMSGAPHLAYRSSLAAAQYIGADAILTKPVERADLRRVINSVVA